MNSTPFSLEELKNKIKSTIVDNTDYMVILKPSEKTKLQSIFSLLEALHKRRNKEYFNWY